MDLSWVVDGHSDHGQVRDLNKDNRTVGGMI
jgi:hypothetical protein